MTDVIIFSLSAVLLLAIGAAFGFWFGQKRGREDAAKSGDVQQAFDDYREQVAEHFGASAGHFQELGKQVRQLYDHMATGADTLCDKEAAGRSIEFSPADMIEPPVDYARAGSAATAVGNPIEAAEEAVPESGAEAVAQAESRSAKEEESGADADEDTLERGGQPRPEVDELTSEDARTETSKPEPTVADHEESVSRAYH